MEIGERIRHQMELMDMTQKELSDKTGMNSSVLNRIILGTRPARDEEILLLSNVLNVSTDYLLGNKTEQKNDLKSLIKQRAMTYGGKEISEHDLKVLEGIVQSLLGSDNSENK